MITHAHHEYLFDNRHRDLETGKMNIDKLTTLNSNSSMGDLMEPGREPSYEYCLRIEQQRFLDIQREEEIRKQQRQMEIKQQRIREVEEECRSRDAERQEKIREIEEYRVRLQIREEQLIKERQLRLAAQQKGTYIISSVGWQARKRRI
jgi:hypothetical protein